MDFMERMKKAMDKSVEVSKEFLGKAGETARDLSSKGVLRLEIRELEGRAKKEFSRLGHLVFEHFVKEEKASVTSKNQDVAAFLEEITRLEDEIHKREEQLNSSREESE